MKSDAAQASHPPQETDGRVLRVGAMLQRVRLERGQSVENVAAVINIRTDYLEAIEASAFERLPGQSYVFGFVRSYADYLDLMPDEMVARLKDELPGGVAVVGHQPEAKRASFVGGTIFWLVLVLAVMAGVVVYRGVAHKNEEQGALRGEAPNTPVVETPPQQALPKQALQPEEQPSQALATPIAPAVSETQPEQTLIPPPSAPAVIEPVVDAPVVLTARASLRFTLKDATGKTVVDATLKPNQSFTIEPAAGLELTLSNASAAVFAIGGEALPVLKVKTPLTLKPLTPATLRERLQPNQGNN